jgi:Raf kinase inhibitor-like YbhB/YbcL family protein
LAVGAVAYRSLFFGPSFGTRYDWTPSAGATPVREEPRRPADLELSSTSVTRGGPMPRALGCADDEHLGRSPALAWSRGPEGTVAYAITMIDMDAKGFVHWALVVPPTVQSLPEGASPGGPIPDGSFEMRNDFGKAGYGGPCPPPGARHDYALQVTALGTPMKSARTTTAFLRAVDEKFIALGSLAFTFER